MAEIRIVVNMAGQRSLEFEEWDDTESVGPTTVNVAEWPDAEGYSVTITSSQDTQHLNLTVAQWAALSALMSSVSLPHPRAA